MSDLAAAAAAMGVPEALVKRSAEARAKATGASADEILAAWAGGAPAPTASVAQPQEAAAGTPAAPDEAAPDKSSGNGAENPPPAEDGAPSVAPPAPDRLPRPAAPITPPVLVGERQGIGVVMAGSLGLLIISVLLSVFIPSLPQPGTGIRSSNHAFSSGALEGREIYASQGCATCHTQLIRNVVADVGIGPVTLDDTNQIIGYRRMGPDLAAIGARIEDTAGLTALLTGGEDHPVARGLSEEDLANLVAYLRESR